MSIMLKHGGPRIMSPIQSKQGCPGGVCPIPAQVIKCQMQFIICWLQLGRTYFILLLLDF